VILYYNRAGQPLAEHAVMSPEVWSEDARRVGSTNVGPYLVSTVHLVIDHSHGDGPPVIFETMVFRDGDFLGEFCARYCTEAEASAGHEHVVGMVRALHDLGEEPSRDRP
jgi:hypothetical protein